MLRPDRRRPKEVFDSFEKENKTKTFIFYLKNSMTRESSGQIYMQEGPVLLLENTK